MLLVSLATFVVVAACAGATGPMLAGEIQDFNRKFVDLHRKTDLNGVLALWAEDGVDLMPGEQPLVGKAAITKWLDGIRASMPGSTVSKMDLEFHDIEVSGNWASEWATEHQVVERKDKPPFEGYGKIALILHREADGQWRIKQEMWNNTPRP